MAQDRIAERVARVPPSGIRRFFDIAARMPDVISLGIGEPDFVTPYHIRAAGVRALTGHDGTAELRVRRSGTVRITATKERLLAGHASLRVARH